MSVRLNTSVALAAAIFSLAGCWGEDEDPAAEETTGIVAPTSLEEAPNAEPVETTDEVTRLEGEEQVEGVQEQAEITSEEAAIGAAETEGSERTDPDENTDVAGDPLAEEDIPSETEMNLTDQAAAAEGTAEAPATESAEGEMVESEETAMDTEDTVAPPTDEPAAALAPATEPTVETTETAPNGDQAPLDEIPEGAAAQAEAESSAVGAASQEATAVAEEAASQGEPAAVAAQETAQEAAVEEGTVGTIDAIADALTIEGFDLDLIVEAIENANLGEIEKRTLIAGVNAAQNNPVILDNMLAQVRDALLPDR